MLNAFSLQRARFARIYYIDHQLKEGSYPNTSNLAEQWEVHPRTIKRDIEFMRVRLAAPIIYDRHKRGYYYAAKDFRLPLIKLTKEELITIFLGQKLLTQYAGTQREEPIRNVFEKFCLFPPQGFSVDFNTHEQIIPFDVEPLQEAEREDRDTYRRLTLALQNKITVWIKYHPISRNVLEEGYIDPYHLRYFQGAWYLIAYCRKRRVIRIFAIDGIKELEETQAIFTPVPDFSLHNYLIGSLGIEIGEKPQEVVIRFGSHQARWIQERRWHHSQVLEHQSDGSLILRLILSSLEEVKRWILSFGHHAEVLAPASLRRELMQEVGTMEKRYSSRE